MMPSSDKPQATAKQALLVAVAGIVFIVSVVGALTQSRADAELARSTTTVAPETPTTVSVVTLPGPPPTAAPRRGISGFTGIQYVVTRPTGTETKCALLAETPEQQANGLMRQPDLGGYDAMLFRFAADTDARFYMANVVFPLSIAFFQADGTFVEGIDMPLCTVAAEDCPTFGPARPYRWAFEVPQGNLAAAGLAEGSTVSLGGPCT